MKIAVVFPSRGLMFSQTADELLQNLQGFEYDIFFAHGLPIPLCFEKPLIKALAGFCEECEKTGCRLCESGNNDTIEAWNVSKKAVQNQDLSLKVNSDDHTGKIDAINTSENKSVNQDEEQTDTSTKTDMSKSLTRDEERANTDLSWNKNLDENLKTEKVSTTSTESERITDQKTLNYGSELSDMDNEQKILSAPIVESHTCSNHEVLKGDYTHIWFVEDDMIIPDDILDTMLIADKDIVAMDYPVSKEGQGSVFYNDEGEVIFTGTGCLLVKREVFDALDKPYFRTDIRWNAVNYGDFIRMTASQITNPTLEGYGLHDTNFGIKVLQAGYSTFIAGTIGQRKLVALGKAGTNEGAHDIEEWIEVKSDVLLKKFQSMPVQEKGKLITVQTVNGELSVHPDKAKKLIKSGVATKMPKRSVVFDFNRLEI